VIASDWPFSRLILRVPYRGAVPTVLIVPSIFESKAAEVAISLLPALNLLSKDVQDNYAELLLDNI
jgi:hypothetical protein